MPARFHFDLESGGEIIRDEVGVEAADLDDATEQAILCIEEMKATGELDDDDGWCIVVRDATGDERRRIEI